MLYSVVMAPHAVPLYFSHMLPAEFQRRKLASGLVTMTTAGSSPLAKSVSRALNSATKSAYRLATVGRLQSAIYQTPLTAHEKPPLARLPLLSNSSTLNPVGFGASTKS